MSPLTGRTQNITGLRHVFLRGRYQQSLFYKQLGYGKCMSCTPPSVCKPEEHKQVCK